MKKLVMMSLTILGTLLLSSVSTGQPIPVIFEHLSLDGYLRQASNSSFGIYAISGCPKKSDEELIACPPGPTGTKWFAYVYIGGASDGIIQDSVGKKEAVLPPKSFQGKTVSITKTITISLDCVNPTTLRMLNASSVKVHGIERGKREHELVLRLTPTK
jgi:hypothetical protein